MATTNNPLTQDFLHEIVSKTRNRYPVPAVAVSTMRSDKILLQEIQGVRSVEGTDLATLNDYFHIGSCAKSVLAVMAAVLVKQQKISWDTPFFAVYPELAQAADSAYTDITLEDLLLCQAGIRAYTLAAVDPVPEYVASVSNKLTEFAKSLVQQPPSAKQQNGKFKHHYSNASYSMAAAMLERVSGQTYAELLETILPKTMGLVVRIGWPNSISPEQPWGHMLLKGKVEVFGPDHEYRLPSLLTPAGDLSMTPDDYAEYTRLHLAGLMGTDNVISSSDYQHIHFANPGFALGVFNGRVLDKQFSGFDGSTGTFYCRSIIVPELDFAFTIMVNAGSAKGTMRAVEWLSRSIVEQAFALGAWKKFWLRLLWK